MPDEKPMQSRDESYDTAIVEGALKLIQRTQKGSTSVLWFHFGGASFETQTHKGYVSLGNVGGPPIAIMIERKDGSLKRLYELEASELLTKVLELEDSRGEVVVTTDNA